MVFDLKFYRRVPPAVRYYGAFLLCLWGATITTVVAPQLSIPSSLLGISSTLGLREGATPALLGLVAVLREATKTVEEERRRTAAERDAFETFASRIDELQVPQAQPAGLVGNLSAESEPDARRLRAVRDAYRETVMSVPHFEDDYDETLYENLSGEFNEEIAAAVTEGRQFSLPLKRSLINQAREAERQREQFLETLDDERDSIRTASARLEKTDAPLESVPEGNLLEQSFDALRTAYDSLARAEAHCEAILEDRQRKIYAQDRRDDQAEHPTFYEYVYQDLPTTFPVLSATAERIRSLRRRRRDVTRALTRRH